ncbi:ATP-dependent RecD-like DNA helicase [Aliiglaciecola sp. 2_MG-2023]|uniref:ATP-dependent DNA helicase n=1 Tax=unclassified Aliiglaciecola TaxID=2593648 RepID=UPI0026E40861|nr:MULTISPECIES: ATP-dependent RecD-like DNA helicase [unclassified Aliiglaciecola]MDO6709676.1 ATP-dependent RecD-like DNA helicase [Aliiglaciecola sp. 2_MG-2023]MDO6750782.1 ATP-dependent RecD-like DNA helicase [Aliiglaciecola sp. 1_MG-2023]
MKTVIGTVSEIIFESGKKQIIELRTKLDSIQVLLNDAYLHVEQHDHIYVRGEILNSRIWGDQIHASEVDYTPVTHELLADFLMAGVGIGKSIANRLISYFPDNLLKLIEAKDIKTLSTAPWVSKSVATVICNNWHKQQGKVELLKYMDSVLINTPASSRQQLRQVAKKAYAFYGDDTVKKLQDDPYRVWAFSSFAVAERLASALKIERNDSRRLICTVEEILFRHLKQGSTQVAPSIFAEDLTKLIGSSKLMLKALSAAVSAGTEGNPRIVVSESSCSEDMSENERLYHRQFALPGTTIMENYVSEQLRERLSSNILPIIISNDVLDNYVLKGNKLSTEQKQAVKMILANSVNVVSGGAGTGKTSVLYCANDLIKQSGNDVLQVALSGKASQRLIQQTDDDAFTIAGLLSQIEKNDEFLDAYQTPVVHIDEASMVDLQSMFRILTVFENKPLRLVFIGDWAQLAPVGIGLIYHKLVLSDAVPKVELTVNFRSNTAIVEAAENIKKGIIPETNETVQILEYESTKQLQGLLQRQYYLNTYNHIEAHIIAARLKTVSESNTTLHRFLSKGCEVIKIAPQFRIGDKVIYKKNDKDLGLVNGSTGTVIGQAHDTMIVNFTIEGQATLTAEQIQNDSKGIYMLQHSYAMTCHSSQGSEFNVAIVVVENFALVERSWLYTAVTRAKQKVVLLAKKGAIQNVLDRGFRFEKISVGFKI